MSDLASVLFGIQVGPEVTPGTGVAASKILNALGLGRFKPEGVGTMFRPQGSKLDTVAIPTGMKHVTMPIAGTMSYSDLTYLLCSAIKSTTPTADGTNGKKWVFSLTKSGADVKQTFTIESGYSVHAQKATFCQVTGFSLEMSKEMNAVSGTIMGQQLQDDVALTGSPTDVAPKIIAPPKFDVYLADAQADLAGASVYIRPIKATFSIDNIVSPLFRMNSTDASYVNQIEQPPNISMNLTTDADDAGMALLTQYGSGAKKFIRVKALGDTIAGAMTSTYTFQLDFSGSLIKSYDPTEENGSALATWTFQNTYDTTWGKSLEFTLINELAAL